MFVFYFYPQEKRGWVSALLSDHFSGDSWNSSDISPHRLCPHFLLSLWKSDCFRKLPVSSHRKGAGKDCKRGVRPEYTPGDLLQHDLHHRLELTKISLQFLYFKIVPSPAPGLLLPPDVREDSGLPECRLRLRRRQLPAGLVYSPH